MTFGESTRCLMTRLLKIFAGVVIEEIEWSWVMRVIKIFKIFKLVLIHFVWRFKFLKNAIIKNEWTRYLKVRWNSLLFEHEVHYTCPTPQKSGLKKAGRWEFTSFLPKPAANHQVLFPHSLSPNLIIYSSFFNRHLCSEAIHPGPLLWDWALLSDCFLDL